MMKIIICNIILCLFLIIVIFIIDSRIKNNKSKNIERKDICTFKVAILCGSVNSKKRIYRLVEAYNEINGFKEMKKTRDLIEIEGGIRIIFYTKNNFFGGYKFDKIFAEEGLLEKEGEMLSHNVESSLKPMIVFIHSPKISQK